MGAVVTRRSRTRRTEWTERRGTVVVIWRARRFRRELPPSSGRRGRAERANQKEAFHRTRNAMLLDLLERFGGEPLAGLRRTETIWPPILPSDQTAAVRNAAQLVAGGIQSRRTAAAALGHDDPEREWAAVLTEMAELRRVGESRGRGVEE